MGVKRTFVCKWIVVPLVLVVIAGAIFGIIRNKVHPSPIPSLPLIPPVPVVADDTDLGKALTTSLKFLQVQKSGKLVNNKIAWRGDSALNDGKEAQIDLSKGMYDAGDHIKFGFPMAFTATILSWSILEYGDYLSNTGNLEPALDGLRWITDYLVSAHPSSDVLYFQVGDPVEDHKCWERPETMTEKRPLLYINKTNPGSDVAGETAAALAAASLVFRSTDATYSSTLLSHSKELFTFADSNRGIYSETFPDLQMYYNSSGYKDELLWAASWLYHATSDQIYLTYVVQNGKAFAGYGDPSYFSWDDKRAGTQVLLSRVNFFSSGSLTNNISSGLQNYRNTAERVMCAIVPGSPVSTIDRTEGGLLWIQQWNSLQHSVAGSFLAVLFSDYMNSTQTHDILCNGTNFLPNDLRDFALSQASYILGNNPIKMSYLVGYGSKYPQQVHHRGASIPADENPSCTDQTWLLSPDPNPNIATGALVGGPSLNDTYDDVRTNALQGEPTTYSSALFTGLLSGLVSGSSVVTSFT
ncbi:hypothetical protein LUZ60_007134 [Juncus effusus]|nr:hypothetical protein LUZ60_007134 [Juncus effusus]